MPAVLFSVGQWRGQKMWPHRAFNSPHYNVYRKSTDTSVFWTCKWYKQQSSVYFASFYIFYASSVALTILLLKKPSYWSRMYVIFVFKKFPIGLKQNLREEHNLYKGQMAHPQCVLCSEVLLYCVHESHNEVWVWMCCAYGTQSSWLSIYHDQWGV